MKNKRGIGLYGGTFDPVHNGHVRVASLIEQMPFIKKLCIHVNHNPHYKKPMFSFAERLIMARDSFPKNSVIMKSKLDFTHQVLKYLRKEYDDIPIYFFVGKEWDIKAFKNASYVIKNCIPVPIPEIEISVRSTQIREMIQRKESLVGLVPNIVKTYIEEFTYV